MRISINPVLFSHGRGGLEGARPSSTLEHQILAEVPHFASIPPAPSRSRKIPFPSCVHQFGGRSGGSQALQLPRASLSRGSFASRLHLDRALQKSEISAPEPLSLIRRGLEGVRPSSSRDYHFLAAARHISPAPDRVPQKLEISVPVLLSHIRRGLEGARPVCFISRKTHRNNRSYCNKNFHQIQLGKINAVKRHNGDNPLHF